MRSRAEYINYSTCCDDGLPETIVSHMQSDDNIEPVRNRHAENGDPGLQRRRRPVKFLLSSFVFAFVAPLLLIGPQTGKYFNAIPSFIPPHRCLFLRSFLGYTDIKLLACRWSWTGSFTASSQSSHAPHLVSIHQQRLADANHRNLTMRPHEMGDANHPRETMLARSIWTYGPFVMSVGILASVLLKLCCAPYCAKILTDFLRTILHAQLEEDDDVERQYVSENTSSERVEEPKSVPSSSFQQQPSPLPAPISSRPASTRKSPKWPCTLDLPESTQTASKHPMESQLSTEQQRAELSGNRPHTTGHHPEPEQDDLSFNAAGLHPALQKAASTNSTFGKLLRHQISRHSGSDQTATAAMPGISPPAAAQAGPAAAGGAPPPAGALAGRPGGVGGVSPQGSSSDEEQRTTMV